MSATLDVDSPATNHYPWRQPKPNKMWPEEVRALIRFYVAAKGEKFAPCPTCGKKRRGRWTMLCPFKSFTLGRFAVQEGGTHDALTLVCSEHPIAPTKPIQDALAVVFARQVETEGELTVTDGGI